jgi:integrase/recombinase XerD
MAKSALPRWCRPNHRFMGRGGWTRAIALPAVVWAELIALRGAASAEDPVSQSRTGKPLDRGRVRSIVREAAESVGVTGAVSPHMLRHAHASHALDHGAPLSLVRDTLGHASISTTSGYLHARPGDASALPGNPGASASRIPGAEDATNGPCSATGAPCCARWGSLGMNATPGKKGPRA